MTSRSVAIVFSALKVTLAVILELLLERQSIKLSSERKLLIDLVLADIEVLHVEEPDMPDGMLELLDQLLLASGLIIQ